MNSGRYRQALRRRNALVRARSRLINAIDLVGDTGIEPVTPAV